MKMEKLEGLNDLLKNPDHWAQRWKAQGGKVIGYLCANIPEEILFAASALPLRVMGNPGETTSLANAYLQSNICPFIRSCLDQGLKGRFKYLDGLIFPHTCDGMCRLHDVWKRYISGPFIYLIDFPHRISPLSHSYFLEEIRRMGGAMEELTGQEISEDSLIRAIEIYNENRRLLKRLYGLRKKTGTGEVIVIFMLQEITADCPSAT